MASSQKDMEPQGRGSASLKKTNVQSLGLNAERIFRRRAQGRIFLLTFPFIGPLRSSRPVRTILDPSLISTHRTRTLEPKRNIVLSKAIFRPKAVLLPRQKEIPPFSIRISFWRSTTVHGPIAGLPGSKSRSQTGTEILVQMLGSSCSCRMTRAGRFLGEWRRYPTVWSAKFGFCRG